MTKVLLIQPQSTAKPAPTFADLIHNPKELQNVRISPRMVTAWGLLLLSFVLRFPYFFQDVIDWDESTFFLMGQSVLTGHLPYTTIWDVKPPLVFWVYAAVMAWLGQNILAIRISGLLLVWISGMLMVAISASVGIHRQPGRLVGALTVILLSFLWSGQATMLEHWAMVPLLLALWLLIRHPQQRWLVVAGGLMALACLIRANLVYTAVAIGLYVLFSERRNWLRAIQAVTWYGVGCIIPILLTVLPFWQQHQAFLWWKFVVAVPSAYAHARTGELKAKMQFLGIWGVLAVLLFIGLHLLANSLIQQQRKRLTNPQTQRGLTLLWIVFWATEISIVRTGLGEFHYLLLLVPFVAIASVVGWHWLMRRINPALAYVGVGFWILCLHLPLHGLFLEYQALGDRLRTHAPLFHGSAYEISAYFQTHQTPPTSIFLMTDQLVYGLLGRPPFTPLVAHPSNITKPYLVAAMAGKDQTTISAFTQLLNQKPEFIVTRNPLWYLPPDSDLGQQLTATLQASYHQVQNIQGRQIYQRLS